VDPHLEVLPGVLVDMWATDHAISMDLGGQGDRPLDLGLGPQHGLGDLLGRLVDHVVVVRLEPDPDLLLVAHFTIFMTRPAPTVRPPSRIANLSPSSMAIGLINSTDISVLSPGITI